MKKKQAIIIVCIAFMLCISLSLFILKSDRSSQIELLSVLDNYVRSRNADIGVCVIIDSQDTIRVNNNVNYPMNSVMKLYQAVAVADYMHKHQIPLDTKLSIKATELHPDTYSPLRDSLGMMDFPISVATIIKYSLQFSDNNACDMLFNHLLSIDRVEARIQELGIGEFFLSVDENAMHQNPERSIENKTCPDAAAALINQLYTDKNNSHEHRQFVINMLDSCLTGQNRLTKPLSGTNATIGHKTGTGFNDAFGKPQGINDVGFVRMPNKHYYAIAVFVKSSDYDMVDTEQIIADISEIVYEYIKEN